MTRTNRLSASKKGRVRKVSLKENIKENGSYFSENKRSHRNRKPYQRILMEKIY